MIDLLPVSLRETLPDLYSQEGHKDPMVYAKFYSEDGAYTWLLTEFSKRNQDTCFGWIEEQTGEMNYFSLSVLSYDNLPDAVVLISEDGKDRTMYSNGVMPRVSREVAFKPKLLSEAKAGLELERALQSAMELISTKLREEITPESTAYVFGVTAILLQQIGKQHPEQRQQFQEIGTLLENIY